MPVPGVKAGTYGKMFGSVSEWEVVMVQLGQDQD